MDWAELAGMVGGFLTTWAMCPQVARLYVMKSAREISLTFVFMFTLGIGSWLLYGILMGLASIIVWNSIALVLGIAMIYAKVRWGR